LERFLADYEGLAVVISHDQRFLDNVVTHVLDVDYGTVTLYTGNYSAFAVQKQETRARKEAEIARAEAVIAEKRAFVERFGAKATKARQAQSRLKQIERIEVEELEQSSRRAPLFRFEEVRPSGREVLTLEHISKSYGPKRVLNDVSLCVRRKERVAVIGPNGLGKSTLLKIATAHLAADHGSVTLGHEVRTGYFAQDHRDVLERREATALDVVAAALPAEPPNVLRRELGRVLFSGDDVAKPVSALSGGEAARLVFCRLMLERPNLLVLDEPTNHLDIESIQALTRALLDYSGTLLFVSHDRAFVSALATRILEVTERGFQDFPGSYQEYLDRSGDDHLDVQAVVLRARERENDEKLREQTDRAASWGEKKKKSNRQKQLPMLRDKALDAIAQAEARKAAIIALWCEPGFFERTPAEEVALLQAEERALGPRIEELIAEWEALEAELASS
jgi:ATPase subunit of ABC transporter with duplicated ATPase domains